MIYFNVFLFETEANLDFLKVEYMIFLFSVLVSDGIYTGTHK